MATRNPASSATMRCLRTCLALGLVSAAASCAGEDPARREAVDAGAVAPDDPAARLQRARSLVRPGSVVQTESRLGVPTFLWARRTLAPAVSRAQLMASGVADPEVAAARAALADYAPLYGLADDDVDDAVAAQVHDRGQGPILVVFRAELGGIEIFQERLNVVMNRDLETVALSGYITSAATPARPGGLDFGLAAHAAAAAAVGQLAGTAVDASQVVAAGSRDGYDLFDLSPAAGVPLDELVRVKKVYFHDADGLEAGYHVEVLARTGAPPVGTLAADGRTIRTSEGHAYVISAGTGQVLFRKNLVDHARPTRPGEESAIGVGGFTYRVWADPVTGIPHDTPAGNGVHPKVVPVPDGEQAAFVPPSDVTLPNFPFSQEDPWLLPGATETTGNNVDAYLNLFSPDGYGPAAAPADPPTGDFRAQVTGADQFLHAQIPDGNGALAEGRQGAIQQLFYTNNFLHDWYYDAGFDEAAGNAQTDNFGRGGLGNDSLRAQVQDFQGFSNANMLTPADGTRPRMRMYVFPSPANMLDVLAPAAIAGKSQIGISMSGPQTYDVTTDIVRATFSNAPTACTVTNAGELADKIAMFDFDNTDGTGCSFTTRISRLTLGTTASAILMVYTSAAPTVVASITGFVAANTRPVATTSWSTGQAIKAQLSLPATVTSRLYRAADRDGALDNQIVFHEYFHFVSNRLVGNSSGLNTQMSIGLGEGWADFNGMLLTVREDDAAVPSNATFNGAYALATYATSGVPFNGSANEGYYFGIRRYPYSTDMAVNPLTFTHISNGVALPVGPPVAFGASGASNAEVHNTGEVWASMLWDCYAGLLRDTQGASPRLTFQEAQDRMKLYLIAALKATPVSPTLTEARDALLAVALASDPADYVAFRVAFARRGAGANAVSPDRYSTTNIGVVEDFVTGPELVLESATLDDSLGSCDADGAVDRGEYGSLTVTLRNTGTTELADTTATISSPSSDVWLPLGPAISFPTIPVGSTAAASLRVAYLGSVTGVQQLDFQIDYTDAQLSTPLTDTVGFRTNTDELAASTATDTVEPVATPTTTDFNATFGDVAPWQRVELNPIAHVWHVDDHAAGSDQYLISPLMTVAGGGSFNVQFDHTWSFEFDGGGNYDGGVIEMSVDGGAFTDIGTPAYNGSILNYSGDVNPLRGRPGFVQSSPGSVHTSLTQAVAPGSTVRVRFRAASDSTVGAPGWTIDDIAYAGVVETPFATVAADGDACAVVPTATDVAITVTDGVASASVGGTVAYTIVASNLGPEDIIGATVADAFPADLTCTWSCAGSAGGACAAGGSGNIADSTVLPVGGAVTYTASCDVSASTASTTLSNTATVALPGPVLDPVPGNNAATDVDALIRLPAELAAGKTVSGDFVEGGTVTYTIELSNAGAGRQFDNAGDELVDVLPTGLALVSALATSGTTSANVGSNTVTWNGAVDAGASVTITIVATITAGAGTTISNQASFSYDADGDGSNEAAGLTDAYPCPPGP